MNYSRTSMNQKTGNTVYWLPEIETRGLQGNGQVPNWSKLACLAIEILDGKAKVTTTAGSTWISNSFWRWWS